MKVTLISYTPNALELLLFTKNTRLGMSPKGLDEIKNWPDGKKEKELVYMLNTIQSSWEFVDYVFCIEGVSRAFTHQLVRHRHASFAQQAQRAVDMTGFEYITGPSIQHNDRVSNYYEMSMDSISEDYQKLLELGVNKQDARGILPTNISTNIVCKMNLRSLHDSMLKRLCVKAQGEAQDVFREMREEVFKVHPWTKRFLKVWCAFHGTCCFPTFPVEECPAKPYVYNQHTGRAYNGKDPEPLPIVEKHWEQNRAEAQPEIKVTKDEEASQDRTPDRDNEQLQLALQILP